MSSMLAVLTSRDLPLEIDQQHVDNLNDLVRQSTFFRNFISLNLFFAPGFDIFLEQIWQIFN